MLWMYCEMSTKSLFEAEKLVFGLNIHKRYVLDSSQSSSLQLSDHYDIIMLSCVKILNSAGKVFFHLF